MFPAEHLGDRVDIVTAERLSEPDLGLLEQRSRGRGVGLGGHGLEDLQRSSGPPELGKRLHVREKSFNADFALASVLAKRTSLARGCEGVISWGGVVRGLLGVSKKKLGKALAYGPFLMA